MIDIKPGDLVVVRTGGLGPWFVRLGQRIQGKPDLRNHMAMLHHITRENVAWFLEGKPGGLGWRTERIGIDAGYLSSPWTVTNAAQPKTPAQRAAVCLLMRKMLGTPYDWDAIESDAVSLLHLPELWAQWGGKMPGHVECSSVASLVYSRVREPLAVPKTRGERFTEPGDWDLFIQQRGWEQPAVATAR